MLQFCLNREHLCFMSASVPILVTLYLFFCTGPLVSTSPWLEQQQQYV